jgi:hypothetical protein
MFNTGTVIGVSANILGLDFHVILPSFSWGGALDLPLISLKKHLKRQD